MFALDSDILVNLQNLGFADDVAALGSLPIVITDVVWSEFVDDPDMYPEKEAQARRMVVSIARGPTILRPETPEAETFAKLQSPPASEGAGEHSIIAYCVHHPEAVPVLVDRRALHRGVEELRSKILSFQGVLGALADEGVFPRELANRIATAYRKRYPHTRQPLWW